VCEGEREREREREREGEREDIWCSHPGLIRLRHDKGKKTRLVFTWFIY
jgi:hypothetical protein